MPPPKVFIFVGCILFILLVGFLTWDPDHEKRFDCLPEEQHSHDGGPLHCD